MTSKHLRRLGLPALALAAMLFGAAAERATVALAYQPNMHAALNSLNAARSSLANASADKAGHRVAAMRYVDAAIREVHLGILAGMR